MTAESEAVSSLTSESESRLFVGRFVRRQGQYGTIAVVGRTVKNKIELIDDSTRLFPSNGMVETNAFGHHTAAGDWVEFEVVRNTRPRAPQYKTAHLRRLPRYAVLPEMSLANYRALLTGEGWRGDKRPGLWALRISENKVLVIDLAMKDGGLRIPRLGMRAVHWYEFSAPCVIQLPTDGSTESVFLIDQAMSSGSFDWSDEADHVAQVIRSLSGANDPRVSEIITWLDLHHEEGTGRVSAATLNHESAMAALRSGELADRLRADQSLMNAYVDAAKNDPGVRDAIMQFAREGNSAERAILRGKLEKELVAERSLRAEELSKELEKKKYEEIKKIENEIESLRASKKRDLERISQEELDSHRAKLKDLDGIFHRHKSELDQKIIDQEGVLNSIQGKTQAAAGELEKVLGNLESTQALLAKSAEDVDRLLSVEEKLSKKDASPSSSLPITTSVRGVGYVFRNQPTVIARDKGRLIDKQVLLTENGKNLLRRFAVLLLSGEIPILVGSESADFLRIASYLICPGRFATMDADPTLISVDDLWARPGSGAPTVMALAADAASKDAGAVLVAIRGVERSGARFWIPALADELRYGNLPRGLFVCCTSANREHDEVMSLPRDMPWLEIEGAFINGAYATALTLLTPPHLDVSSLNPGLAPSNLSQATQMVVEITPQPTLSQSLRIARMFAEAQRLLGDDIEARKITIALARSMIEQAN